MNKKVEHSSLVARQIVEGGHAEAADHFPLPPPQTVIIGSEMAGLRQALEGLQTADREELDEAFQQANEEAQKPGPDKARMAQAICRVIKLAKAAKNYPAQRGNILPRIAAIASWLGQNGPPLLKEAEISV